MDDPRQPAVLMGVLLLAIAGAAVLIGLQGNGAAFLGVFPALCLAAFVLPVYLSAVVAGAAIGAVSAAWLSDGRAGIAGIVLNDFAIATGNASAASAMPSIRPPRISTRASGSKPEQGDMHR